MAAGSAPVYPSTPGSIKSDVEADAKKEKHWFR